MWVARGGPPEQPLVLYEYAPSRSAQVPPLLLAGFAGYLQTDGNRHRGHRRRGEIGKLSPDLQQLSFGLPWLARE